MGCQHTYRYRIEGCPHPPPPEAERCIWHNAGVRKDDAYVARLVAQAAACGDLCEAHLAGLHAPRQALAGLDLRGADLRDAVLDGSNLARARLGGANLRRISLQHANLAGADLSDADLTGANLRGADLTGAQLSGAILDGTVLHGAVLAECDLGTARLRSLRWNGRTDLRTARGLPDGVAPQAPADEDDASADTTRTWTAVELHPSALRPSAQAASDIAALDTANTAPRPAPQRRPWLPWTLATCALALAVAGTGLGVWGIRRAAATAAQAHPDTQLAADLDAARRQAEANLAEVRRLQGLVSQGDEAAATARAEATRARSAAQLAQAQAEDARRRLAATEADLLRLRTADDRATVLALRLDEAQRLAREQAILLERGQRMGEILAQGAKQLGNENAVLDRRLAERLAEEHRADLLGAELARTKAEAEQVKAERETLSQRVRRLDADLADARTVMEGYLKRVAEADLGHLLGDEEAKLHLLPVKPGGQIALGGEYLVSLRIDPTDGGVAARLVVQRPAAAANPDVTVMLYDRDQRPLRRLGFGFPHIDQGQPFVSGTVTVACDRFPAYARVLVTPAVSGPVSRR